MFCVEWSHSQWHRLKERVREKERDLTKKLVTQGKSDRGAADTVGTDWRMSVITWPKRDSNMSLLQDITTSPTTTTKPTTTTTTTSSSTTSSNEAEDRFGHSTHFDSVWNPLTKWLPLWLKSKKNQEEKYHWPNRSDSSTRNSNLQSQNDEGKSSVSKKAQKSTTKALISTTKSGYLSSSGPKDFMKKRYSSEILQVGYSSQSLILAM